MFSLKLNRRKIVFQIKYLNFDNVVKCIYGTMINIFFLMAVIPCFFLTRCISIFLYNCIILWIIFHLLDNKFIDKIEFAVAPWVRNSDKFDLGKYWMSNPLSANMLACSEF